MELPAYLAEEALRRLRSDLPEADLQTILEVLDLDLAEPGPDPDFESLRSTSPFVPENESRDTFVFTGYLSALGDTTPVCLRYVYVGEFGLYPDDFDGFAQMGVTARLEMLAWETDASAPRWEPVNIAILSQAMIERIDELVLEREQEKFENEA